MDWQTRIRMAKAAAQVGDMELAQRAEDLGSWLTWHTWRVIISFVGNGHVVPAGRTAEVLDRVLGEAETVATAVAVGSQQEG